MSRGSVAGPVLAVVASLSAASLYPEGPDAAEYRVTAEFRGVPRISPDSKSVTVAAGPDARIDVPIRYQVRTDGGAVATFGGGTAFVPTNRPVDERNPDANEAVPVGLRLSVRLRPLPDGKVLLDAELTDTRASGHDMEAKTLTATTAGVRKVQPAAFREAVEVVLPQPEAGKEPVAVSLRVFES